MVRIKEKSRILFIFVSLIIGVLCFGDAPKIVDIKTTADSLTIYFSTLVKAEDFKFTHYVSNQGVRKNIYDVEAEFALTPTNYKFDGGLEARVAQYTPTLSRVVFYSKDKFYTSSENVDEKTIKVTLKAKTIEQSSDEKDEKTEQKTPIVQKTETTQKVEKQETSKPTPSVVPTSFKDKIIVIDPGHGGKDCGAMSVIKICEKQMVLGVGKYLKQELNKRGYKKVYLTRDSDIFIKLRERTKFANDKNADIFVSVHANSLDGESASKFTGFETYFLSNARSDRAKRVAALENKKDIEDLDYFSKDTLLSILNTKRIIASNKLALDVQSSTLKSLKRKYSKIVDGGVREGPFWVLVGAQMPSILVEIGYLSNKMEAERLSGAAYQKYIADGLADGIENYFAKN